MKEPIYPVFVLIWDEQTFMQVNDDAGLSYFEEPDLCEGPYRTWDSAGQEYVLQWDTMDHRPRLVLEREYGVESFRSAVAKYAKALLMSGRRSIPNRRCDPADLAERIAAMQRT